MTQAFPLQWPAHRKRTKAGTPSAFKVSAVELNAAKDAGLLAAGER